MSIFTGALVFVVIWWIVWFIALPFGVSPTKSPEPGHTESAPEKPRLWFKALITTAVTAVLAAIAIYVIESGLISLGE
ncbi:MAG: DUF1467 family protein [Alphaproteobacteria bacterium]|nr:DUF1467 family protein [Alphaproteobacteria bacterium]